MTETIFLLHQSAERIVESLVHTLETIAAEARANAPPTSLVRLVFAVDANARIGSVVLPLPPLSEPDLRREYRLSPTQARVAVLLAARLTNAEIAEVLGCTVGTVRNHVGLVYSLLGVHHRHEVAAMLAVPPAHGPQA